MKLSSRSYYGLRATIYLARNKGICSVQDIAKKEGIPYSYLEKILQQLKKANLVITKQGALGGYSLARSPDKVTVGQIFTAIGERTIPLFCVLQKGSKKLECPKESRCSAKTVWLKLENAVNKTLSSIKLSDLCSN